MCSEFGLPFCVVQVCYVCDVWVYDIHIAYLCDVWGICVMYLIVLAVYVGILYFLCVVCICCICSMCVCVCVCVSVVYVHHVCYMCYV